MADIANPINPEGDVLDYEAEEPDEDHHEPVQQIDEPIVANAEPIEDDENVDVDEAKPDADEDDDEDEGAVESLEEGEVSDEDEESRKERLKPQPVCRFYSKGQCTWGSSCRFVHPGVLDKGNYNMFAPPRPILPAEQEPIEKVIEEQEKLKSPEEPVPTVRYYNFPSNCNVLILLNNRSIFTRKMSNSKSWIFPSNCNVLISLNNQSVFTRKI